MSLILDALNRSRQDVGDIPGLQSQHQLPEGSPANSNRRWIMALALALAAIAYLLYERGDDSTPDVRSTETAVAPEPVEPIAEMKAAPVVAAAQDATRDAAPAAEPKLAPTVAARQAPPVQKLPARKAPDAEVSALYAEKAAPVKTPMPAEGRTTARTRAAQKPATPPTVEQPAVSEKQVDLEAIMSQAQDELENAQLDEHPAPFLASLSQQSKDRIPTIFYERHDYSGRPGQSSVVLSGKSIKAGGRTSSGVRVDEILPDSVVLTYKGTQFRLRALNSWVNL